MMREEKKILDELFGEWEEKPEPTKEEEDVEIYDSFNYTPQEIKELHLDPDEW